MEITLTTHGEVAQLLKAMASPLTRTPEVVDRYYTLCIPFYREFLGRHWHTGFYAPAGPIGPADQLCMELRVASSACVGPGTSVLDVGCGIGGTACHLAQATGARVHGVTPNAMQLELAREHSRDRGLEQRATFSRGTADALPFPDQSFDVVLFFESACHFPDRPHFFSEVSRVLRPGGRVAGEDWIATSGLDATQRQKFIDPICDTWAIPDLGTLESYADAMASVGLQVHERVDMRQEMALRRGFIVDVEARRQVQREIDGCGDPIRSLIMKALLILGDAVAHGAFTIGRFLATKPGAAA